ncbi:YidB family protein [Sulfurovum sp.]|uniref:YidB family protein n=1 Tax=Sulfurovum sp. TaxID=1969726 RepID=UPI0028681717|nr:YidB family protein [Sulfurovum sp.]
MEISDLLKMGASLIQGNSDDATTGLNVDDIAKALDGLVGNGQGGVNLVTFVSGLSENGLGAIVGSWLGQGENKSISTDDITKLLGSDKVSEFASSLGLSEDSAQSALADVIPQVVDKATSGEGGIMDEMLAQVGGPQGAMDMLGKMFR